MVTNNKRPVAVVVGGAVAGSEAVEQLHQNGFIVLCIEQNPLPWGKIDDGLPRWHVAQRQKEQEKINDRIDHENVHFIPNTNLGRDLTFETVYKDWGVSAILFANGAWRDRLLGIEGIDEYVGRGLLYQNPLVHWFNHYHEPHYSGPRYEITDDVLVVGGGLASLDVLKITQMEITLSALRARGIEEDMLEMEKLGIPKTLEKHGLKWEDLGLKGSALYYRRRIKDMPLAEAPEKATPEQIEKTEALREKILGNYQKKFLFTVHQQHLPKEGIVEGNRLVGLKFVETKVEGKRAIPVPGTEKEVRCNLIISSIGSVPDRIPGLPEDGEYYAVEDMVNCEIKGLPRVYALGNAVTGKGNIRVSMMHSREISQKVAEKVKADPSLHLSDQEVEKLLTKVKARQKEVGYTMSYRDWVKKQVEER